MASFTDQISQFNPYIQELPVEAMVQVGMAKQAQYDQGVQKVQNEIDRVAGLDISKPQHKQYLESKMNELGNKLKTVAAGDFSNQQLVNSVSGMTGQIIKDPIIQNAVYSTQVLRKGENDREIAAKAGKTSPANDDLWNDTKAAWFNNEDLNTPFSGRFIERWDVDKKLTERAEMILKNPDTLTQEQRFKHDEKGNTLYFGTEPVKDKDGKVVIDSKTKQPVLRQTMSLDPSKGQPQEDDAINRITVKGVSAEKLYNNFLDSLDSRDAQQLKIDARYKYKNATAESFAPDIAKFYGEKKAFQSQEIVNLTEALSEPGLTSEQKAAITARITNLQQQEKDGVIQKEFLSTMEALKDPRNLEKYKEDIYTQQHLMNMAKDMSFKSYEQEIKSNPYMQMFMQKQNYNLDVIKFNDSSRRDWATINLARDKFEFDKFDKNREYNYKITKDELENPDPVITTTTLPTLTTAKTVDSQWLVAGEKANLMQGLQNKYAARLFPGLNVDQQRKAFSNLYKRYDTNPNGNYSPDEVEFLDQYRRANNDMLMASNLATAAEKAASEKRKELLSKNAGPGAGGFTGEEILTGKTEINNWIKKNTQGDPRKTGAITKDGVWNTEKIKQEFRNKGLEKLIPLVVAFDKTQTRGLFGASNVAETPNERVLNKAMSNVRDVSGKVSSEVDKFTEDFLAKNTPKKLAQDMALDMTNEKTRAAVNKYLTSAALTDDKVGAGDAAKVLKLMSGEGGGKMKAAVRKLEDGSTQTVFVSPDGSSTITLNMNAEQRGFFPEVKQSSPYGYLKNYIEISPNRTADVMNKRGAQVDPVNAVSAPITGFDLPGFANDPAIAPLVRFTPEGNYDNNGSSNDTYLLNMFIKDPKSNIWKAQRITPRYVPWGGLENIMNNVGKDAYFEGLKTWK
jgi:hypothetical protein